LAVSRRGTEIIADHMLPPELRDADGQTYVDLVAPVAAERREPWLTFLSPRECADLFAEHGFRVAEHVRQRDFEIWNRTDGLRPADLAVLTRATRV
jgi:O-methyltransferase involved in polyketide biosynthesis